MRHHLILLAALLASASPATAQVTVDLRALDALPATGGSAAPAPPRHVARRPAPTEARRKPAAHPATAAAKPVAPKPAIPKPAPPKPVVAAVHPAAPPPATKPPATKPPATKPAATPPPAPAPKQTAAAAPTAVPLPNMNAAPPPVARITPIRPTPATPATPSQQHATKAAVSTGLKVSFPPGKAGLSPDGAAAIKRLVASAHADATATYNVVAYAAGTAGDPSVARRLSLSRALAVRGALMADGVNSARIYVRAMGANVPSGPPDRADVTLQGGNDPSQ